MSWQSATALLNQWGPWFTVIGILWRIYAVARKRVTEWMDVLLDNHLHHVQLSLDKSLDLQQEQTELLRRIASKH